MRSATTRHVYWPLYAVCAGLAALVTACASIELPPPPTTTTQPTVTTPPTTSTTAPPTTTTTLAVHRVTGFVIDHVGRPIPSADVVLGEKSLTTNSAGIFVFETSETGLIAVSKIGWSSETISWTGKEDRLEVVLAPITVRGLHVSFEAAGDDEAFAGLLDLAENSAVNALVFDTKKESGTVLYDTSVRHAHDIGAVVVGYDPHQRVAEAHERGLYAMTRIVTFEDSYWAESFPEEKLAGGWVNPTAPMARAYNIELAREACEIGFDEIQFDYIRYPSGKTAQVSGQKDLTEEFRVNAIVSFLAEAGAVLEPLGCQVSAAVFGIVVSTDIDHSLGQRPEEMSPELHALSPMLYPSHYPDGWRGLDNPNDHPYTVVAGAIDDAFPRLGPGTLLRPWLQAFWWTNEQILTSIMAAEDRGAGWMLWNWNSDFDLDALPKDEDLGQR